MSGLGGRIATMLRQCARTLSLMATMGTLRLSCLVILYATLAALPVAMVYAFGGVVQVVTDSARDDDSQPFAVAASVIMLGALLASQRLIELVTGPTQMWVSSRIDMSFRSRLAASLTRPAGIAHGETESMRGYLSIVSTNVQGNTPGTAIVARFALASKTVAGLWCLVIVAEYSVAAAATAVVLLVARKRLQQRSFRMVYESWGLIGAPARRHEYWRSFHVDPAAAKEMRVFDLSVWSLERLRTAAVDKFAPVWAGRKRASRSSWLPFGIGAVGAFAIFAILASYSGLSGSQTAEVIAAGLIVLKLSEPANENLAVEHARTISAAAMQIELAADAALRREHAEADPRQTLRLDRPPHIRFEGLRFAYPNDDRQVLQRIDLDIAPGSMLALVGSNGAGKSTIVKLLARLYDPSGGRITADGMDIRDLDAEQWRRNIAVMLQGFVHYELSLKKNVQLGAAERWQDAGFFDSVRNSLGIDDLVRKLPHGWDTILGTARTGGVELSGGEWQRVGLARAAFAVRAGRTIVVLDEPTAHLDAEAEQRAQEQLNALAGAATLIVVSHRLGTTRHADQIAVIADGCVQEMGTHTSLLSSGAAYARMYAAQSEQYRAAASVEAGQVTG